jgi:transcriptional regulator with XRE-family HTH domain
MTPPTIKAARVRAGLTVAEVAARLQVSSSTVHRWERDAPPSVKHLRQLARVLGISVEKLVGR